MIEWHHEIHFRFPAEHDQAQREIMGGALKRSLYYRIQTLS